jgi:phosphonate transport system substrate-binding protein
MNRNRILIGLLSLFPIVGTSACSSGGSTDIEGPSSTIEVTSPESADTAPTGPLTFAFPPGTDDPNAILQVEKVAQLIGSLTGREVRTENPADYMAVVEAVRSGFVDVALMSQFSVALAIETNALSPLVVWEAEQLPASLCLVRTDSSIQTIEDLRGRQIAFVDPGSTTGHFMPRSLLSQSGLEYQVDYQATFAGGHDTAILAMMNGGVDMACTARQLVPIFQEAGLFAEGDVRVVGETDPIPVGISIVVRNDLDQATRDLLAETLPDALMAQEDLLPLFGGSTDYIVNPDASVYAPLLKVARDVGLDLDDLR